MIGKCKAIAHGSTALDYIFREGKLGSRLAFHNLCSREPKTIYEEMKVVSDYNSRWGCVKTKNSEKLPFILTVSLPHKY